MATRLVVTDFSCINEADIELDRLTVLIGPQASGKSVLSKLIFFFNQILIDQLQAIEDGTSVTAFKAQVRTRFKEWFPVDAWGSKKFRIEFTSGAFEVRFTRMERNKKPGDNIRMWMSPFFEKQYSDALTQARKLKDADSDDSSFDLAWKLRESVIASLRRRLRRDFFEIQTFIPAGRSFFTSVGKSIAAFEYGGVLDPLILRFGRVFANLRERASMGRSHGVDGPWVDALQEIMGGVLIFERNREYLKTRDGRKIPVSTMSSGQQELMPLLLALRGMGMSSRRRLVTIEEPEAHLFPEAQSALVEILAGMLNSHRSSMSLLITTHSPYVLAKFNNLIKAGQLGGLGDSEAAKIGKIVPKNAWISLGDFNAYAICDARSVPIVDRESALIDGGYLDNVSGDISKEFSRLIAIEVLS